MYKTEKTVLMLKTIATVGGLALLLWTLGLPSLRFADAANNTTVSDTLSDSAPSAESTHTIDFVSPSGVATSSTLVVTFPSGASQFDLSSIGQNDIDLLIGGTNVPAAKWSVATTATTITLTLTNTSIAVGQSASILIGTNATNEGSPDSDILNPSSEGSYEINLTAGASDSGSMRVVILSSVVVSASVPTVFSFSVGGVAGGQTVNGVTTTGSSSSTSIPFGKLQAGVATTVAQSLTVNTNANNGYVVTVQVDQPLQSSTGADIDGFVDGSYTDTPTAWASPSNIIGDENTYGHWGVTSDDATTSRSQQFASGDYISASTSPRIVMSNDGPVDGTGTGVGTTKVGYTVEIGSLQEAGDDYTTTLTYVATPTF